jgi:dolichyl-phosphate-mannose-protein mannosyltransferase
MQITKRDLITIAALSVIFFAMATWNLGLTQAPVTTAQLSAGQSFYVDLGSVQTVKSVCFLLEDGSYNLTITSGSPGNWSSTYVPASFSDYYKWNEVQYLTPHTTRYIKVDFYDTTDGQSATIAEIAVINPAGQRLAIASVHGLNSGNANLSNLIDEQNLVQYPATYMTETYFDEIYFVRTAEQYLHLQWPYEWTHPPLGKLVQAAGIEMFGFSPFGWRFMGVMFGTLMIAVMYLLGKRLFGTWIGGFAAAFLLTFDFMHFTMARMGTADTYVVFFSLLSQLFFFVYFSNVVKNGWKTSVLPLFLAVIFFFLSFSTKWLALYGALGMLALLAALRLRDVAKLKGGLASKYAAFFDNPFLLLMAFIALGVGIYFAIYIPDMIIGRPFISFPLTGPNANYNAVVNLQFAMFNYHATLTATHPFSSVWWSWPFMVSPQGYVPLWLWVTNLPNNIRSTIAVLGNPAVWWVGFASIIAIAVEVAGGDKLASHLRVMISKKASSQTSVQDTEVTSNFENGNQRSEMKTKLRNSLTIVAGFLIFTVTAICSEVFNYHSFLLAFPTYAGMFMAVYGMTGNLMDKHEGKDVAPIFIIVVFFFSWIPYTFLSRATFIYHFYVSVPFMCLASAYFINRYWNTKPGKIAAVALFASIIILFIVFYPVTSGAPEPKSYIESLEWFKSWYF